MYVAITRARNRLYLSFSQTRMLHGQTRYSLRSRFLDELPEASLKWLTPRVQARGASREGWGGAWEGFGAQGFGSGGGASRGGAGDSGHGGGYGGAYGGAYGGRSQGGQGRWGERAPRVDRDTDTGRLGASEARAAQRFDRGVPFRIGQNVAHARFGEGVIVNIEGSGTDARVQVNFGREGVKWLALSVAKLEAIG